MQQDTTVKSGCHNCPMRARAQANPKSLFARLWRWHITWCPGWKAYLKELQSKGLPAPQV